MDHWQQDVAALHRAMRAQTLSPVELLDQVLGRVDSINPAINALIHVDARGARAQALESERRFRAGTALGPLDGIPISVKDNLFVAGMPATWGSRLFKDHIAVADEWPIARLRAAGAVIFGKTNVPEFTLQGYTDNALFGPTRNPWNLALTPGGSSGGAVAAVAAGLAPLAVGTDGAGSIRRPASHTGLVGLKPSTGRIARGGGFPQILYDLEVIGLVARSVGDTALLYMALAGPDLRDRRSLAFPQPGPPGNATGPAPKRILFLPKFGDSPVDPEIASSVETVAENLARLGHAIEMRPVPFDLDRLQQTMGILFAAGLVLLLKGRDWCGRVGETYLPMIEAGEKLGASDYLAAVHALWDLQAELAATFAAYDFILTPAAAALPWPATEPYPAEIDGRQAGPRAHAIFTGFANAAGLPGISLPCRPSRSGLPIGFQLVGCFGAEDDLLALAGQYEQAHPWASLWPPIAEARD